MNAPGPSPLLQLSGLTKRFGDQPALEDVSLDVAQGEFICLLGPSGCGKSTLLRTIAGFETPDAGTIRLDGEDLTHRPPHRRPVNMMFQSYALFPHMSVERNIAYGLHGLGLSRAVLASRVADLTRMLRLDGLEARRPHQLSGGQRQRVALARALAREPKLLLLDEPLGALDRGLREATQAELRALQRRLRTSFVVVTHDPEEAMALADRICVMRVGRLIQQGTPRALYEEPEDGFVAGILGDINLLPGRLDGPCGATVRSAHTAAGAIRGTARATVQAAELGSAIVVAIRPERCRIVRPEVSEAVDCIEATLVDSAFLGDRFRWQARLRDGSMLRAIQPLDPEIAATPIGAEIRFAIPPDAVMLLPV